MNHFLLVLVNLVSCGNANSSSLLRQFLKVKSVFEIVHEHDRRAAKSRNLELLFYGLIRLCDCMNRRPQRKKLFLFYLYFLKFRRCAVQKSLKIFFFTYVEKKKKVNISYIEERRKINVVPYLIIKQ